MKFTKKVLKNGLRMITAPMKDNKTATVLVLVETGSKYENKKINGLSHFFEHMCFKGTLKRPKSIDISRELDGLGSQSNAFTSHEFTGYYAKSEAKNLNKILDIISDIYLNSNFSKEEIEKEKRVIIEEINMYEDLPQRKVQQLLMELLYGDQPAGWSVAGLKENIKNTKREDFVNYKKDHYVSSATTVVVSGNINEKKVIKDIEKVFSKISDLKKKTKLKVIEKQNKPEIILKYKKTDQTHLALAFRSFDIFSKWEITASLLASILGHGMSSRLWQKLREEMGVCYYVRANNNSLSDHGFFEISAGVDNKRVNEVINEILKEINKLKIEKVSNAELKKAKDFIIGNMYLGLESSDEIGEFFGLQEIMRQKIKTPDEFAKKIRKVSSSDIQKLANLIFKKEKLNLALVGPIKNKSEIKIKF
ncbi:MAG: pitrilysin family protein [Candidatus Paceibacterota bacterium]